MPNTQKKSILLFPKFGFQKNKKKCGRQRSVFCSSGPLTGRRGALNRGLLPRKHFYLESTFLGHSVKRREPFNPSCLASAARASKSVPGPDRTRPERPPSRSRTSSQLRRPQEKNRAGSSSSFTCSPQSGGKSPSPGRPSGRPGPSGLTREGSACVCYVCVCARAQPAADTDVSPAR